MNRPKVLSVCTSAYNGGAARAAFRIHQGVNALGGDSTMFVKGEGNFEDKVIGLDEFIPDNFVFKAGDWAANKIKNKWQHYQWRNYKNRPQAYLSDLRSTNLHNALKKINFDVLHLHWINGRFFPIELLQGLHKPIVWTLHDSWPFCGACHYFLDCEEYKNQCGKCPMLCSSCKNDLSHKVWEKKREYFEGLDLHIVSPSNWLANCAKESSLFKDFPITVIPNCIDTNTFRPMAENEISPKWRNFKEKRLGKNFILYGAMNAATDKRKGFSSLLSALQILENSGKADNLELVVFGESNGLGEINLSIPVHNAGVISDTEELVSLYNIADVTVVPSITENLSCTIMESLACGTPVAAFDIGGNRDIIEHTQNGFLTKEKNDNGLADGLVWCIYNKEKLTTNALKKVKDCYTIETVCKQYISLYNSIL